MTELQSFASDNNSGVHPKVLEALARANHGSAPAYGEDPLTREAENALKAVFGSESRPWLVSLGTAANILGLKSLASSHHGILCAGSAHINTDECGAPEALIGCKLLPLPAAHGKVDPQSCLPFLAQREDVHTSYPIALSISQTTECGTAYSLEELRALGDFCRAHGLYFHMDGARLANAAAGLGLSLREITGEAGVDVLSFGGTKNGLMAAEAVIFFNPALGKDFGHIRKQNMQLVSKMRFLAAQMLAYLDNDLWLENALRANAMAALLAGELEGMEQVALAHPVQANAVFVRLDKNAVAKLRERFYFYILDEGDERLGNGPLVRLMTSFNTTEAQVLELAGAIRACAAMRA